MFGMFRTHVTQHLYAFGEFQNFCVNVPFPIWMFISFHFFFSFSACFSNDSQTIRILRTTTTTKNEL